MDQVIDNSRVRKGLLPQTPAAQDTPGATPSTPAITSDRPPRRQRKPFGQQQQKLAFPAREGYHLHWFNDTPGRILRAQEAGYEHVKDHDGKNMSVPVGVRDNGDALIAYLMEIPLEWYVEDMAAQQKIVDELDHAIRGGEVAGKPGEDGRYIPSRGISIKSK